MYSIFTFFYNSQEFYGDKRSKAALFLVPNVGRYWGNQIIWGEPPKQQMLFALQTLGVERTSCTAHRTVAYHDSGTWMDYPDQHLHFPHEETETYITQQQDENQRPN